MTVTWVHSRGVEGDQMLTCQRWMCKYVQSNNNFCTHDQLTRKANPAGTSSALFDRRLLGSGATLCLSVVSVGLGLSVWSGKGYPIAKYRSWVFFLKMKEWIVRRSMDFLQRIEGCGGIWFPRLCFIALWTIIFTSFPVNRNARTFGGCAGVYTQWWEFYCLNNNNFDRKRDPKRPLIIRGWEFIAGPESRVRN